MTDSTSARAVAGHTPGLRHDYLEMMRAHIDDGGQLSHRNGLDLLIEVNRLGAINADMLAALEPFANLIETYESALAADAVAHWFDFISQVAWPSEAECRKARAAVAKTKGE